MNLPLRVLIVEDSEADTRLLLRELRQGGFEPGARRVATPAALKAALAGLEEWDVVISDYNLPNFNGLDALKIVQATGRDLPFILISGAVGEEEAVAVMKAGAHDFLLKDRLARLAFAVERELGDAHVRRQRRQAEESLRVSENRLRFALQAASAGAWDWDIRTGDIVWSPENYQLYDIDPAQGAPRYVDWESRVHPEDRDRANEDIRAALEGRETEFRTEFRVVSRQGAMRWLLSLGRVERDEEGKPLRMSGLNLDITARKQAEDSIRELNAELEARVAARTAALQDANKSLRQAIEDRRRLEEEVVGISEAERARIGQDLHDDLGQQLAGIWCLSTVLENNLKARSSPEAGGATKIAGLLSKSLALTRSLARGLQPVVAEPGGLVAALDALAGRSSELFKVRCRLECRRTMEIHDPAMATHLYRIAQEAVTNACKHGRAKHIHITLSSSEEKLTLSVSDDGKGLTNSNGKSEGMGMRIMNYRAESLGGSLEFRERAGGGTVLVCTMPPAEAPGSEGLRHGRKLHPAKGAGAGACGVASPPRQDPDSLQRQRRNFPKRPPR